MPKLVGSVTEGSNDAFAEASIVTQLSTLSRTAWVIELISIERSVRCIGVDAADISVCLSRGTKTAMPNVNDRDVIFKTRKANSFTTSGATNQDMIDHFNPTNELLIVEEVLYLQIDSTSIGTTVAAYISIDVRAKQISEAQRLGILAGRISS